MDIDLIPHPQVDWEQDQCPWNKDENTTEHKCAIKNISICKFFKGVEDLDIILCGY